MPVTPLGSALLGCLCSKIAYIVFLYGPPREKSRILGLQKKKVQTHLPIRTDCSVTSLFSFLDIIGISSFTFLSSLWSWEDWFEPCFGGCAEDRLFVLKLVWFQIKLIKGHTLCFHEKILSKVNLCICSRCKKADNIFRTKLYWRDKSLANAESLFSLTCYYGKGSSLCIFTTITPNSNSVSCSFNDKK